jgi:pimeloyl-ACP methyl ester carboxylesterase
MAAVAQEQAVCVPSGDVTLEGDLWLPDGARGVVLFSHGSGSSRHSPRNRFVAMRLHERRLGTLLFDLLTREEEEIDRQTAHLRFDIDLLAVRLSDAVRFLGRHPATWRLPVGLFGASTGAAAALVAGARYPGSVAAIVSRGGRLDLAGPSLGRVRAPTLLIVGGDDTMVIELNQHAYGQLRCAREMKIVPGASHLFEEPGALQQVADLAAEWFTRWIRRDSD